MPEFEFRTTSSTGYDNLMKWLGTGSVGKRNFQRTIECISHPSKIRLSVKIGLSLQTIGQTKLLFITFNAPQGWKLLSAKKLLETSKTPLYEMDALHVYEFPNRSEYECSELFLGVTLLEDLPTPKELKVDMFQHMISNLGDEDFQIKCNGETVAFNKAMLQSVSDVFQTMFKRDSNKEVMEDCMEIEDFSVETIKDFKRAILEGPVSPSIELMMFAHKYNVKPLLQYCERHIGGDISFFEVFEVIKAAYLIDSDSLLNKAVNAVVKDARSFSETEDWKTFKKAHPDCFIKMMDLLMFSQEYRHT